MKKKFCKNCIAFNPDKEKTGNGTCSVSGCSVNEYNQGCIDWRYYKIWRP